ncbi:N-6 DNA methylase [bacterium]|nr:N-6 DNA methylase [bacterium]
MLDQTTKRKIDSARNILVGKVPDPKAQVEQITTALVYKFMDDMDKESEELGGKARFFTNGFSQYSWTKLLDKKLSGQERLDLYVQAITNMSKNPHIPQLFRDIFKGAFLPFRDPRTLTLFLKEINEFSYDHSEDLGNAFEYLLSILGSQGDAGQFRTPRHIIDFIAEVIDPKKNETILDPACGTAGFLISAYKHILKNHDGLDNKTGKPTNKEKNLTPEEKTKLMNNIVGYDISPDMVKLSLVNMYLHGFSNPKIYEYDSLTSEKRWDETFDVIMANPPFMTPKGGIQPHKRFSIQANRAEVLFVDYIMEHLSIKGRAGIIVPEGIIFKGDKAYKVLRKKLVEDGLFAVVSLPAGVFNPYAGVKTSILFFDNQVAKRTDKILFVKVENDGFDLGAQRRPIDKNDLPKAIEILESWKKGEKQENEMALWVEKEKIAESGDYNLTGERYREVEVYKNQKWLMVELGNVLDVNFGERITKKNNLGTKYPVYGGGGESFRTDNYNRENEFVISRFAMAENCVRFVNGKFWMMDSGGTFSIKKEYEDKLNKTFVGKVLLGKQKQIYSCARGNAQKNLNVDYFKKIKIPLPPLSVQKEIVEQIEVKQNAINHAKEVIKNLERERRYFGQELRKLEDVEMVELGKIIKTITPPKKIKKSNFCKKGSFPIIDQSQNFIAGWTDDKNAVVKVQKPLVIFGDHTCILKLVEQDFAQGADGIKILETKENILPKFLYYFLQANPVDDGEYKRHFTKLRKLKIPLPPLAIQKQLVAEAEKEENIIASNRRLIKIMERKIEKVLNTI